MVKTDNLFLKYTRTTDFLSLYLCVFTKIKGTCTKALKLGTSIRGLQNLLVLREVQTREWSDAVYLVAKRLSVPLSLSAKTSLINSKIPPFKSFTK